MNDLWFEIPKILWGGAHRAPSLDPSPALSRSYRARFGLLRQIRALRALDYRFARFEPPTFEAWLRPCYYKKSSNAHTDAHACTRVFDLIASKYYCHGTQVLYTIY